jgi:predicted TIM-barrel fold metal-dependent hydrolase
MKPIFLDRIARKFPTLKLIGAHLGNPWYEEAAMTLFWNENVYFDLSGTVLKRKGADWFADILWWSSEKMAKLGQSENTHFKNVASHTFDRICFGSDVPIEEMEEVMGEYEKILEDLSVPGNVRTKVMGGNVAAMVSSE